MTPLLELRDVSKVYGLGGGLFRKSAGLRALADVSLTVGDGEVVGLVGESGSGKSTLGRIAVGLEQPTSGEVRLAGDAMTSLAGRQRRARLLSLQMIFQNAVAALNPRQRVRDIIAEPIRVHRIADDPATAARDLAERVGIPASLLDRYPHEMSGGQCQRIGIARALSVGPRVLVCDEPVSALDVSIQAQVLNLFADLKDTLGCAYLFISHDLHVVELLSDRVAIMYLGRIVEIGPTEAIYAAPRHPYTQALLESAPRVGRRRESAPMLHGEIPSPLDPPRGCPFHPRCPAAMAVCREVEPAVVTVGKGHRAACHLLGPAPAVAESRPIGVDAC
jgi:oligopeptide/dipeptide ABC transporter ATP-binding protein